MKKIASLLFAATLLSATSAAADTYTYSNTSVSSNGSASVNVSQKVESGSHTKIVVNGQTIYDSDAAQTPQTIAPIAPLQQTVPQAAPIIPIAPTQAPSNSHSSSVRISQQVHTVNGSTSGIATIHREKNGRVVEDRTIAAPQIAASQTTSPQPVAAIIDSIFASDSALSTTTDDGLFPIFLPRKESGLLAFFNSLLHLFR